MEIASDFQAAKRVQRRILAEVAKYAYDECAAFAIRLAMEEGLNNAIRHGNGCDPGKKVAVEYDVDAERVVIVITDEGEGFEPRDVPDPTDDENLEKPCGRGIMLIRAYMDEVGFNERGNRVRMVKRNSHEGQP